MNAKHTPLPFKDFMLYTFLRTIEFNENTTKDYILENNFLVILEAELINKKFSNIKEQPQYGRSCFYRILKTAQNVKNHYISSLCVEHNTNRIKYSNKTTKNKETFNRVSKEALIEKTKTIFKNERILQITNEAIDADKMTEIINKVIEKTTDTNVIIRQETLFGLIYETNICYSFTENQIVDSYIIELINSTRLTDIEIDKLFNPRQNQPIEKKNTFETTFIKNETDNETSSDTDGSETETEDIQDKTIKNNIKTIEEPKTPFKLIFEYNKYYNFDTDKQIIEQSFINKYNTNNKLKTLTDNYSVINIIKPITKNYTEHTYFNFILTTYNHSIISAQYHAYLKNNEINSITEIINIL